MDAMYTTEALATGAGRNGHATVKDSDLDFTLAIPKEMGGSGGGANPEQLFAAGYAACFHSALQAVARNQKVELGDSAVGARVASESRAKASSLQWTWRFPSQLKTRPQPSSLPTPPTRSAPTPMPPGAILRSP